MRYLIYILLVLVSFSCKKEKEPEVRVESPDFYLQGKINGETIRISAGDNGYYMNTSAAYDENQIAEYRGILKKENCSNCGPVIQFTMREREASNGAGIVIQAGKLGFQIARPAKSYKVRFNAEETFTSRAVNVEYHWDFGDGTTSNEKNPTHYFPIGKEFYDVCLTVETSKGVASTLCNKIYLNPDCATSFGLIRVGHQFELRASHRGGSPNLYYWQFGDRFSASTPHVDYNVTNSEAVQNICLTITDENGCISQKCKNLIVYEELAFTVANFNFIVEEVLPVNGLLQTSTASLDYIDQYGEVYSSKLNGQNQSNTVTVLGVEEYEADQNGLPVKRIHVLMNANLTSKSGKSIKLESLEGYLGVAYLAK